MTGNGGLACSEVTPRHTASQGGHQWEPGEPPPHIPPWINLQPRQLWEVRGPLVLPQGSSGSQVLSSVFQFPVLKAVQALDFLSFSESSSAQWQCSRSNKETFLRSFPKSSYPRLSDPCHVGYQLLKSVEDFKIVLRRQCQLTTFHFIMQNLLAAMCNPNTCVLQSLQFTPPLLRVQKDKKQSI